MSLILSVIFSFMWISSEVRSIILLSVPTLPKPRGHYCETSVGNLDQRLSTSQSLSLSGGGRGRQMIGCGQVDVNVNEGNVQIINT